MGVDIWDDVPYPVPCFVLTHRGRDELVMRSGTFTFVTDGVAAAVARAVAAAGERNVEVMGGGTARQVIAAGLLDELQINLVPVLLGGGVRMFPELGGDQVELERSRVVGVVRRHPSAVPGQQADGATAFASSRGTIESGGWPVS